MRNPQSADVLSTCRWLPVKNTSGGSIPPFAVMKVEGKDSEGRFLVGRPDGDSLVEVMVNGPFAIHAGESGSGTRDEPLPVLYETSDGTPAGGESWGTISGSWKLRRGKTGFRHIGAVEGNTAWFTFLGPGYQAAGGVGYADQDTDGILDHGQNGGGVQNVGGAKHFYDGDISVYDERSPPAVTDRAGRVRVGKTTLGGGNAELAGSGTTNASDNASGVTTVTLEAAHEDRNNVLRTARLILSMVTLTAGNGGPANDYVELLLDQVSPVALTPRVRIRTASGYVSGQTGTLPDGSTVTAGFVTAIGSGTFATEAYADAAALAAVGVANAYTDSEIAGLSSVYQPLDADLTALAALTGTNDIYYRSAANTWTAVAIGTGLQFASGTLSVTGTTMDITGLTAADPAADDTVPFYDVTATANRKATFDKVLGLLRLAPGGRLTLTSGTPVTTSDVTGATTWYYTPYLHDCITLWDGTRWVLLRFTEASLVVSGGTFTSSRPCDIFGYLSGGALALEGLSWSGANARATAVTIQDGRYCKSGDKTRLYLGTVYVTSGGNTTVDTITQRFVWNMYNRVRRPLFKGDSTDSWSYTTQTWRQANATSSNQVEFVRGLNDDMVYAFVQVLCTNASGCNVFPGIGVSSTSANSAQTMGGVTGSLAAPQRANYQGYPSAGYHFLAWLEASQAFGTTVWYGDNGFNGWTQSGIQAEVMC